MPVEQRGGGEARLDNDVPAHLRNDFPHTDPADTKTKGNGRANYRCHLSLCCLHACTCGCKLQAGGAAWQQEEEQGRSKHVKLHGCSLVPSSSCCSCMLAELEPAATCVSMQKAVMQQVHKSSHMPAMPFYFLLLLSF